MVKHPLFLVIALILLSLTADLGWRVYTRLFRCSLVKGALEETLLEEELASATERLAEWKKAGRSAITATARLQEILYAQGYRVGADDFLWSATGTTAHAAPLIISVSDISAGALVEGTMERLYTAAAEHLRAVTVAIRFGKLAPPAWPSDSSVLELGVNQAGGPITVEGDFHSRGLVDSFSSGLSRYCAFPMNCMKVSINGARHDFQLAKILVPAQETPHGLGRMSAALGKAIALMANGKSAPGAYIALSSGN